MRIPRDAWVGLVMLAIAVLYWLGADAIRISALDGPVGAAGLPKALAYGLGFFALVLIARSLLLQRTAAGAGEARAPSPGATDEMRVTDVAKHLRALGMLALGIVYLLIVPYAGYALSVMILLAAVAIYNGAALSPRLAATVALGAVFFYLLFVRFLDIPLPPGLWPDLSRAITG